MQKHMIAGLGKQRSSLRKRVGHNKPFFLLGLSPSSLLLHDPSNTPRNFFDLSSHDQVNLASRAAQNANSSD